MARQWIAVPQGATARELARACSVSLRTARRWLSRGELPRVYQAAIATDLTHVSPAWRGFRFFRDELVTPEGLALRPGEIASIPIRQQQVRMLELAIERLRMGLEPEQHQLALGHSLELEDPDQV